MLVSDFGRRSLEMDNEPSVLFLARRVLEPGINSGGVQCGGNEQQTENAFHQKLQIELFKSRQRLTPELSRAAKRRRLE
jgi:hypothetical protein